MEIDFTTCAPVDRYKILTAVVVPRPIAWVTSIGEDGVVNAAPFSFFNAMGSDPAVVAIGIGARPGGGPKDTLRNIRTTGEFVVNVVTHAARMAMNATAADFPPHEGEVAAVGLETRPAAAVRVPRLALSPAHLECRLETVLEIGANRIVIGRVVHVRIDDAFIDPERLHVAAERLDLIGRMHGRGWYSRTTDRFDMPRVTPEEARAR